ncbi:MAG: hypothetical protein FD122_3449 [Stygiobacter sp.]|nr:MAG: hypothetical protein FD122_3449 [Stygiobacter sp.]
MTCLPFGGSSQPNSSPNAIINSFCNKQYSVGLVQVISWGTMWRKNKQIYNSPLQNICNCLHRCRISLLDNNSINSSWEILQNKLNWSQVMISKVLHFLVRSLEGIYVDNPPVPIDNAVMLNKVWKKLSTEMNQGRELEQWRGGLMGYLRYMTFINYLREFHYQGWGNTQIEATLFKRFYMG